MKILVVNCGSSSLKYQLMSMENNEVLVSGKCDRIGVKSMQKPFIEYKKLGRRRSSRRIRLTKSYCGIRKNSRILTR